MAKIIGEKEIQQSIKKIVEEAEKFVVLISPYVSIDSIENILSLRTNEKVFLQLFVSPVHRHKVNDEEKDLFYEINQRISRLPNCFLHVVYAESYLGMMMPSEFTGNFHAKCYFNEKEAVITSMNLSSFIDRVEIGIYIDKASDKQLYNDTLSWYFDAFCKGIGFDQQSIDNLMHPPVMGYCIRCGQNIPLNEENPYCVDCLISWSSNGCWGRYKENYCHYCGQKNQDVCFEYPIERNCYREYKRKLMCVR